MPIICKLFSCSFTFSYAELLRGQCHHFWFTFEWPKIYILSLETLKQWSSSVNNYLSSAALIISGSGWLGWEWIAT